MSVYWNNFIIWIKAYPTEILKPTPSGDWIFMKAYFGLAILFWLAGLFISFLPISERLKDRLSPFLWFNAFLSSFLLFFRYQQIPYLGMDIWRVVQEISGVIWIIIIFLLYRKEAPREAIHDKVLAYKQKYLPKHKK